MEPLYHYCSTQSFHSIIEKGSIWLSSLTLSNDSMEGKQIPLVLTRLAEGDALDQNVLDGLLYAFNRVACQFDGLGLCLSQEPDLLSQWRGYADDGSGVSIGFSRSFLEVVGNPPTGELNTQNFRLQKVEYSPEGHESLVKPTYDKARSLIPKGAFTKFDLMPYLLARTEEEMEEVRTNGQHVHKVSYQTLFDLVPFLFSLKAWAFREEKEWRLVSILYRENPVDCLFRSVAGKLIPYRQFKLGFTDYPPIEKIYLGPKHKTPVWMVKTFLHQHGYGGVEVCVSEASYQ